MQFTNGGNHAFKSLMKRRSGSNHYDSGVDGQYPECQTCRYHQPYRSDRSCHFTECPCSSDRVTANSRSKSSKGGWTSTE